MSISFYVNNHSEEIGSSDFLHAFFSTISYYLEPKKHFSGGWGSKFPELMNELYQGKLESNKASKVLKDIYEIREKLKGYPPEKIIWDIEDLKKTPPWGDNISSDITDLSNYFTTSNGKDLFDVLIDCLKRLEKSNSYMIIQ